MRASKANDVVGIIVGGRPALCRNGVISSATIEAVNEGKVLLESRVGLRAYL